MQPTTDTDIAIVGAGPIGVEATLYALQQGHDVRLIERDQPGAHIEEWAHVEFFSPWKMNRSEWGTAHLRRKGIDPPPGDEYPTGREYLERYLHPLSCSSPVEESLETDSEVLEIARQGAFKSEHVGAPERADTPFVLRVDGADGQRFVRADAVLDTTGVYELPNGLGPGGTRAVGEREHADAIEYGIPDILGDDRNVYRDAHTLVVGDGYSAATTLRQLETLREEAPETEVTWLVRDDAPPYTVRDDDPLPARRRLGEFGNAVFAGDIDGIEPRIGTVERLDRGELGAFTVGFRHGRQLVEETCEQLVANVGYRPNLDMFRELQVHTCYATEGPMDLAASLMAEGGEDVDCLDQSAGGRKLLEVPEPNFFILGSKSYGRNSNFLLRVGFEQIEQVFDGWED